MVKPPTRRFWRGKRPSPPTTAWSIIAGLEALNQPCAVTVHSDSQYVIGILRGNKARANQDLVARLRSTMQPHVITAVKVAAHTSNPLNERVHDEARRQADLHLVL